MVMKRAVSVICVLVLCLSLCACGKSKEAIAVDEMILGIGEVSVDSKAAILDAEAAYEALSDKDKEAIENYEILADAKEDLFKAELYDLANRILEIRYNCNTVAKGTRDIWDNVGPTDFWTYYNAVKMFVIDESKAYYDTLFGKNMYASVWCAASALCPENIFNTNDMTEEGMDKTIDVCVVFNSASANIDDNIDALREDVRKFRDYYEEDYEEETDTLNEWFLELDMYIDFVKEPSGNLNSFTEKYYEYEDSMDRFAKTMDSYY